MSAPPSLPVDDVAVLGLHAGRLHRLREAMGHAVERGRLPGAVMLVARHGRLALFEAVGRVDPAGTTPMPLDAVFRIYSMTKPMVSVAVMQLVEQGRVMLNHPASRYLPAMARLRVARDPDAGLDTVPLDREPTVQDLLRHTSGLTYEFIGNNAVQREYERVLTGLRTLSNAQFLDRLVDVPLKLQPGTAWDYGRSTDVLGCLLEAVTGRSLGEHLHDCICAPLGLHDTGFHVPEAHHDRLAQPFAHDPDSGDAVTLIDVRQPSAFESGGGGMVSTAGDYARFLQMLLDGGRLDGVRLLSRSTVEWMTADHLGSMPSACDLLLPGHGFGLGFTVRLAAGEAPTPGSVGSYAWSGIGGTCFFVDPRQGLVGILMAQAPGQRDELRQLFRQLVYAALDD